MPQDGDADRQVDEIHYVRVAECRVHRDIRLIIRTRYSQVYRELGSPRTLSTARCSSVNSFPAQLITRHHYALVPGPAKLLDEQHVDALRQEQQQHRCDISCG